MQWVRYLNMICCFPVPVLPSKNPQLLIYLFANHHYNTNIDINIDLFGRPLPSQQLRQPEQLGGASQVLPTTFTWSSLSDDNRIVSLVHLCMILVPAKNDLTNGSKSSIDIKQKVAADWLIWNPPGAFPPSSTHQSPARPWHLLLCDFFHLRPYPNICNLMNTFLFGSTASSPPATTRQSSRAPAISPALGWCLVILCSLWFSAVTGCWP